jgi:hypothetical protein
VHPVKFGVREGPASAQSRGTNVGPDRIARLIDQIYFAGVVRGNLKKVMTGQRRWTLT